MSELLVEFKNYTLSAGFVTPLRDLSFELKAGDSLSIIGSIGSGKSMLLYVLAQLIWEAAIEAGAINQKGLCRLLTCDVTPKKPSFATLETLRAQTAFVSERNSWLPVSIAENFLALQIFIGAKQKLSFENLLTTIPMQARLRDKLYTLSELLPEQVETPYLQQLALVRALLRKPKLLLLDEPFLRMDPVMLRQSESLILECVLENSSVVWATNDLRLASRVSDWTAFMMHGRCAEFSRTTDFYTNPKTREAENFILGREI